MINERETLSVIYIGEVIANANEVTPISVNVDSRISLVVELSMYVIVKRTDRSCARARTGRKERIFALCFLSWETRNVPDDFFPTLSRCDDSGL